MDTEIIKIQLRKPKNWSWQLSTSRSSPHIAFPIVQLFNNKGQLLLDTLSRDNSRTSWHSSDRQLQRCRSDLLSANLTAIKEGEQMRHKRAKSDATTQQLAPSDNGRQHPRYKTRTSSAGTLIIPEETFNNGKRRKRPTDNRSRKEENNNEIMTHQEKEKRQQIRRTRRERSVDNDKRCQRRNNEKLQSKECDLLNLVRGLSTNVASDDRPIKMGANVSRHSSKGLSGRRSQSSGSICKSSKQQQQQQQNNQTNEGGGGSLPGYLDDRNIPNNNNHQHQDNKGGNNRQQLLQANADVRIPSQLLGNGAPLHWKFSDNNQTVFCDQGYGSERSPEEEFPPAMPMETMDNEEQCYQHLEPNACYPFITPDSTFTVRLNKSSRGLGLSVTGGIDSGGSWPGLIRIKRLFPHQPASTCGHLNVGDLILEANGVSLTGLTNYEALEVLRTAPNQVDLRVCRPPPDVLSCVSPVSEVPPPPPRRVVPAHLDLNGTFVVADDEFYHGEFEVTLQKVQGSLGFTLRKEDDSALGHYVRALVREPALTDGRLKPGDKILSVNDTEICAMTHEQAVQFLRMCGDIVKLRLYRDSAQTPVAALSPTGTTPRASFNKHLRQEAVDMLNDIRKSPSRKLRRNTNDSEQFHEALLDMDLFVEEEDKLQPLRPNSLDLYNPNQTPVAGRKPRFNFTLAHNAYELNNLDADVLDAPNFNNYNPGEGEVQQGEGESAQEPCSMPHLPVEQDNNFAHANPVYLSAHATFKVEDGATMKKWRGVVFESDTATPIVIKDEYQVIPIELNRGWNSRLGFSLQGAAGVTYVSAVHPDSVAARDGRIRPGDRLLKVNDESVENLSTSEIIDLLRIVRGPVCIVISRLITKEDCQRRSNAVEN